MLEPAIAGQQLQQLNRCSNCGGREHVTDIASGETICAKCGLVLTRIMLDNRPEWRAFTLVENRARKRVGAPITHSRYDKGLSTTFQPFDHKLSAKTRRLMLRLKRWQIRTQLHSSRNRNLSQAMGVITRLVDRLHLPRSVKEKAALLYRRALDKGLVRGRSVNAIATATLYAACRITQTPRSLRTVVRASERPHKEVARCYRLIQRELNLTVPIDTPMKYVSKIGSILNLSQCVQNRAVEILREARKVGDITGKGPAGMAAAALYVGAILEGEKVTQNDIAIVSGVTEVTVRNRYKGLVNSLSLEISALERTQISENT